MDIEIQKPDQKDLKRKDVFSWPIWEKEVSKFDWYYDSIEECYLLEGKVIVETKDGKKVEFGKGDFVKFPKGLSCNWEITEPARERNHFYLS